MEAVRTAAMRQGGDTSRQAARPGLPRSKASGAFSKHPSQINRTVMVDKNGPSTLPDGSPMREWPRDARRVSTPDPHWATAAGRRRPPMRERPRDTRRVSRLIPQNSEDDRREGRLLTPKAAPTRHPRRHPTAHRTPRASPEGDATQSTRGARRRSGQDVRHLDANARPRPERWGCCRHTGHRRRRTRSRPPVARQPSAKAKAGLARLEPAPTLIGDARLRHSQGMSENALTVVMTARVVASFEQALPATRQAGGHEEVGGSRRWL